ncbi:MAG: diphosphomevalonate decarboxylase [Chitinophagaceae bacterium]|nr:diphosphomevalonate decarboxylase [Chitinophagaceae bacterium]
MSDSTQSTIKWRCPSNIAIIKYWGKKEHQIPANPSVSMTLSAAFTEIEIDLTKKTNPDTVLNYFFEGKKNEAFEKRILHFLPAVSAWLPVLSTHALTINSHNSFPHSAGIASSASSFGALALGLLDASYPGKYENDRQSFLKEASRIARLGSGSACRSMAAPFCLWGEDEIFSGSNDEYAVPVGPVHPVFQNIADSIIIVDDSAKAISSSQGHALMKDHEFAAQRFEQAGKHTRELLAILGTGDWEKFIRITESEALTLHAMMMSSPTPFLLMKPGTLSVIQTVQSFRKEENLPLCFTLDAGPNVHILYPADISISVRPLLEEIQKTGNYRIIQDQTGKGPEKLR